MIMIITEWKLNGIYAVEGTFPFVAAAVPYLMHCIKQHEPRPARTTWHAELVFDS